MALRLLSSEEAREGGGQGEDERGGMVPLLVSCCPSCAVSRSPVPCTPLPSQACNTVFEYEQDMQQGLVEGLGGASGVEYPSSAPAAPLPVCPL